MDKNKESGTIVSKNKKLKARWFVCKDTITVGYFSANGKRSFFVDVLKKDGFEEKIKQKLEFFEADHQRLLAWGFKCVYPCRRYVVQRKNVVVLKTERLNDPNDLPCDALGNRSTVSGKWIPQFCGRVDMSMSDHVLRVLRGLEIDVWLEANGITREAFLKKLPRALRNEIPTRSRIERP